MIKENEMKTQSRKHLTNLQHELLKLFSFELPDEELKEVKQVLTKYFAEKLNEETSRIWEERTTRGAD